MNPATLFPTIPGLSTGNIPSTRLAHLFNTEATARNIPMQLNEAVRRTSSSVDQMVRVSERGLNRYNVTDQNPGHFNSAMASDVRYILNAIESARLDTVRKSALHHDWESSVVPEKLWANLSSVEKIAVTLFETKVKPLISKIEARQQDASYNELAAAMIYGDAASRKLFTRFQRDVLAGGPYQGLLFGSLHPAFPDKSLINGMIGPGITLEDFKWIISGQGTHSEIMRPTTVVELNGDRISVTPLPLHPEFREWHMELSEVLKEIAGLNISGAGLNDKLKTQLLAWSKFFVTGTATDEAVAVQATIDAGDDAGNLRVHIGPSESYWSDNVKFPYLLLVGIRDPKLASVLAEKSESFQLLEDSLEGTPHYAPRNLSPRGGFADPMWQVVTGGFVFTFPYGEPLALNFPCYPYAGVKGASRFIFLDVYPYAVPQIELALTTLFGDQFKNWPALAESIKHTCTHESGHMLGPQRSHITPEGSPMGVIFGDHWGRADEAKADLTAVYEVALRLEQGKVTRQEAEDEILATVGFNLSRRYKGKAVFATDKLYNHSFGHMLLTGRLFESGGLTLAKDESGTSTLSIDFDKVMSGYKALWHKIISYQAAGNLNGFLNYANEVVNHIPDAADQMILQANADVNDYLVERSVPVVSDFEIVNR